MKYLDVPAKKSGRCKSEIHTSGFRATVFFWLFISEVSLIGSSGLLNDFLYFGYIVTILINIIAIYILRFFPPLLIILLFNILFYIYAIPHFFFNIPIGNISPSEGLPYLTQVLWGVALFISVFMMWVGSVKKIDTLNISFMRMVSKLRLPKSPVIFNSLVAAILVSTLFGVRGMVVIDVEDGYSRYIENLQSASGLQEYLLVLFFISGAMIKKRFQKFLWYVVLTIFIVKLSLIGLRIVGLMGILLGLWFSGIRMTFKKTLLIFLSGFFLMTLIGMLKNGAFDLMNILFEVNGDNLVSHHGNVLWASTTMIQLIDEGVINLSIRLDLLIYYLLNTLVPSRILQELFGQFYLGSWLQDNAYSSGGGHAATYAYVAGGSCGIVLVASFWGFAFKTAASNNVTTGAIFFRCLFLMTLITFPRWISYDIGNFLFRLPIYAAVLAVFLTAFKTNFPRNYLKNTQTYI